MSKVAKGAKIEMVGTLPRVKKASLTRATRIPPLGLTMQIFSMLRDRIGSGYRLRKQGLVVSTKATRLSVRSVWVRQIWIRRLMDWNFRKHVDLEQGWATGDGIFDYVQAIRIRGFQDTLTRSYVLYFQALVL